MPLTHSSLRVGKAAAATGRQQLLKKRARPTGLPARTTRAAGHCVPQVACLPVHLPSLPTSPPPQPVHLPSLTVHLPGLQFQCGNPASLVASVNPFAADPISCNFFSTFLQISLSLCSPPPPYPFTRHCLMLLTPLVFCFVFAHHKSFAPSFDFDLVVDVDVGTKFPWHHLLGHRVLP